MKDVRKDPDCQGNELLRLSGPQKNGKAPWLYLSGERMAGKTRRSEDR